MKRVGVTLGLIFFVGAWGCSAQTQNPRTNLAADTTVRAEVETAQELVCQCLGRTEICLFSAQNGTAEPQEARTSPIISFSWEC